jgi:hypothetical protein
MTQFNQRFDKTMSEEQFGEVVGAIVSGKYSWACVLILRFAGYNPLHYIPYRTYNRLVKDNVSEQKQARSQNRAARSKSLSQFGNRSQVITDLEHLEPAHQPPANIRGGHFRRIFSSLQRIPF